METRVWFHADDYGVSIEQSKKILACYTDGVLNSISVLPNTNYLAASLQLLNETDPKKHIRRVLHLNFVEGRPLAGAENVPLLVDRDGLFDKTFSHFFRWNYTKKGVARHRLKEQIKAEIREQIRAVTIQEEYGITAIDSHQHYHMLPIIFDSLMEVLAEKDFRHLCIQQIRVPVDPLEPVFHHTELRRKIPKINWIKWCVLKLYAYRAKKILKNVKIDVPVFFGIFYTCEMNWKVVHSLLPAYRQYACKKNLQLELMFHPGDLSETYELLDERKKELVAFYLSENRFKEAQCLKLLKDDIDRNNLSR